MNADAASVTFNCRCVWVTDMWAQWASGPHVSDTPIAPTVKSSECGIDILERR